MMIKLCSPKVEFNEFEHTYKNEIGVELNGVTSLLKRQLFANKYAGISETRLAKAAERGNLVHRQIEMFETFGGKGVDTYEVKEYDRLKKKWEFTTIATEHLVSDCFHVASSIDVIFIKDGKVWLCDIKTTSSLDMEYLSWQLSIYKYLLLIHNPDLEIGGLVACWLPNPDMDYGLPKMVVVEEKPMEWVKALIEADAKGEQWVQPIDENLTTTNSDLVVAQEITTAIANLLKAEKAAKSMKEKLRELMEANGVTKWENNEFTATIGKPSKSSNFDSKALAKDDPDTYEKYLRTIEKKGSFSVKLKD